MRAEAIRPIAEAYWVKHHPGEFDPAFEDVAVVILESKERRRFDKIARALNEHGLPGPRGRPWRGWQVKLNLKLLLPKGDTCGDNGVKK